MQFEKLAWQLVLQQYTETCFSENNCNLKRNEIYWREIRDLLPIQLPMTIQTLQLLLTLTFRAGFKNRKLHGHGIIVICKGAFQKTSGSDLAKGYKQQSLYLILFNNLLQIGYWNNFATWYIIIKKKDHLFRWSSSELLKNLTSQPLLKQHQL